VWEKVCTLEKPIDKGFSVKYLQVASSWFGRKFGRDLVKSLLSEKSE
jgi:hypothetical protein